MDNQRLHDSFSNLSTPLIADAVLRSGGVPRFAPHGIKSLIPGTRFAGRVRPVRHYGSVDVFFEAMLSAKPGDILVIDNAGRTDEGCIGDLTVYEARAFGIMGMIVWGCHRDTQELRQMGYPLFSYGTCPFGPRRLEQQAARAFGAVQFGPVKVDLGDIAFADDDGVVFTPGEDIENIINIATEINTTERRQAKAIERGITLHEQFKFDTYLAKRKDDPAYTFRKHLRIIGSAIEA